MTRWSTRASKPYPQLLAIQARVRLALPSFATVGLPQGAVKEGRELVAYRVNAKQLPGSPDAANKTKHFAIFVHGCFWHRHSECRRTTLVVCQWLTQRRSPSTLALVVSTKPAGRHILAALVLISL